MPLHWQCWQGPPVLRRRAGAGAAEASTHRKGRLPHRLQNSCQATPLPVSITATICSRDGGGGGYARVQGATRGCKGQAGAWQAGAGKPHLQNNCLPSIPPRAMLPLCLHWTCLEWIWGLPVLWVGVNLVVCIHPQQHLKQVVEHLDGRPPPAAAAERRLASLGGCSACQAKRAPTST